MWNKSISQAAHDAAEQQRKVDSQQFAKTLDIDAAQCKSTINDRDATIAALHDQINRKYQLAGDIDFVDLVRAEDVGGRTKQGKKAKISLPQGTVLFIGMTIRNLGQPTSVGNYRLEITTVTGVHLDTRSEKLPEGTISLSSGERYSGEDALYEKTVSSIPSGQSMPGLLMFFVAHVDKEELRNNARLTLSFRDIADNTYVSTWVTSQKKEGGGPLYYPGMHQQLVPHK